MGKRSRCRSKSCVRARKRSLRHLAAPIRVNPSRVPCASFHNRECSLFETYLYCQQWLPQCDQTSFFSTLRRPLPVTFRIREEATLLEWQNTFMKQSNFRHLVKSIPTPVLTARDDGSASSWVASSSWQVLPFALDDHNFRSWLSLKTKSGLISRQEFVSMIPVFLLGIQAQHCVLDLCSSPGSKTIQAMDSLYQDYELSLLSIPSSTSPPPPPPGYVIANEIDPPRAYILAHRCRDVLSHRMQSLAITCHNACKFPDALAPLHRPRKSQAEPYTQRQSLFDRIICDVPCSGDGTLRKDFKVWKTWHPTYGIELHSLQIRIAKRGIALLKIGGLMTYSTCSFHPIENEAVVSALLQTGCVEVASRNEIESIMSGIKYREGLTSWKVLGDQCEELTMDMRNPDTNKPLPNTLWPPPPDIDQCHNIKESLKRCIRMVPHDNDTGGFFIALLRKVQDFPHTSKKNTNDMPMTMVTPKATHHQYYPVPVPKDRDNSQLTTFTRSPKGTSKQHFKISSNLSDYMISKPGSNKLNFVYAGHCLKEAPLVFSIAGVKN